MWNSWKNVRNCGTGVSRSLDGIKTYQHVSCKMFYLTCIILVQDLTRWKNRRRSTKSDLYRRSFEREHIFKEMTNGTVTNSEGNEATGGPMKRQVNGAYAVGNLMSKWKIMLQQYLGFYKLRCK